VSRGLILVGPPGVGKGTQAELLNERLGLVHLSSGEIFRAEIDSQSDLGRLAQRYIDEGRLVPNGITIEMMAKRLRTGEVRRSGFILDGFPRTVRQAEALDTDTDDLQLEITAVVSLVADEDVVVARLSERGRADDDPETIKRRIQVYHEETRPVLDYYEKQGLVRHIDSDQPIEDVHADIVRSLGHD
jgi:adenylate kinase